MTKMQNCSRALNLCAMRDQLCNAAHVAADFVLEQRLVIAARLMPTIAVDQCELAGAHPVVVDKSMTTQAAKESQRPLNLFIPVNIHSLRGPDDFRIELRIQ